VAADAEVIVVGLGVGGEFVAGRLAEAGRGVVGIESALVGGECPYWGCVPSKMIIRAANTLAEARRVGKLAGHASVQPDWPVVARRIREEATDDWDDTVAVQRFTGKGGRFVRGRAAVTGSRTVVAGGREFRASRGLVLATGTRPAVPPVDGLAGTPYWTNHGALEAMEAPASLTVAGGGAVGVELAQAFARFGTAVTIVEAADRLLPGEEPEAGELIGEVFRREGIRVLTRARLRRVSHDGRYFTVHLDGAGPVHSERLLVAAGRRADLTALGVAAAGIDDTGPFIAVDDHLRAADGVWSVGDVTGAGAFTHVAMYQARIAARDILGQAHEPASYRALPRVTFTDPEVGAVGLTEAQARGTDVSVRTAVSPIPSSSRGWIHGPGNDGFIKLIADTGAGTLIGATSAGPAGGEVLGALAVAVHARVPVAVLSQMIYAYPTFHRAIEDAITQLSLRRPDRITTRAVALPAKIVERGENCAGFCAGAVVRVDFDPADHPVGADGRIRRHRRQAGNLLHQPAARRGRLVADRLFITQPALTAPPATSGAAEIAR
jgi:pyruvate/2-oxoglutarate dehydrogenase complex dihydrolipoamide dehydrogenase (E3) component